MQDQLVEQVVRGTNRLPNLKARRFMRFMLLVFVSFRLGDGCAPQEYQMATSKPENAEFITKITAGPMVEEDDKYMIGSFFLVEATREEAQKFLDNDPFMKASSIVDR